MYRIETHLHTTYISRCGWLGAEAIMKYYTACGYDAICVTDHYNRECFDYAEIDLTTPGSKTQAFLQGYHRLKKVSRKITISACMRVLNCVLTNRTMITCCTAFTMPCWQIRIASCARVWRPLPRNTAQTAHCSCSTPVSAKNAPRSGGISRTASRCSTSTPAMTAIIDLALAYAKEHHLIMTAGSDCHRPGDQGTTGIHVRHPPEDSFGLADLLRSGNYTIIRPECTED